MSEGRYYGPEFPWGNDAGKRLDMIANAYSRYGQDMTRREVAEHFGISEDTVKDTLKSANFRKADPPFNPARLADEPLDDLVDEGIEARRHAYKVKAARAERRDLERRVDEAESLVRDHELKREHILNGVAEGLRLVDPPSVPSRVPGYSENGVAYHVPIADAHVGLQVYGKESWTGENYHTDLAAERIIDAAKRAAGWIDSQRSALGPPRVVHYSVVGDLFHALQYATVSGRPMQVDGRARRVFEKVVNAIATALATLAQVAPVEGRLTDGNHDGDLVFYAATAIAAYFRETPTVSVETSYNHQCSFLEGETLHILDHGRKWSSLETKGVAADAAVMVEEIGDLYPPHRSAKIWVGDKHAAASAWTTRRREIIRLPALASLDDYAQGLNYSHDYDAYVYALTERGGIGATGRLYE